MLCNCTHCNKQFEAQRSTATFCSDTCSKAYRRKSKSPKISKRLTPEQKLKGSAFMQFLVSHVKRAETLAVLPAPTDIEGWHSLQKLHAESRMLNYALSDDQQVHIAHYYPSSKGGKLHADNLGIWPATLNKSFGQKQLPFGRRTTPTECSRHSVKGYSQARIITMILSRYGDSIIKATPSNLPATPVTKSVKRLMQLTSKTFDQLMSLKRSDLNNLFTKYDLDPVLDTYLSGFTITQLKEHLIMAVKITLPQLENLSKAELISLLKKHNVTKGMVKPKIIHMTLSDVFRKEAAHQRAVLTSNTDKLGLMGTKLLQDLETFHRLTLQLDQNDSVDAWAKYGSLVITGEASKAVQKLTEELAEEGIDVTHSEAGGTVDPNACLELSDGTRIYEDPTGRQSSELSTDQLYLWYAASQQYDKTRSVTAEHVRNLYDNQLAA